MIAAFAFVLVVSLLDCTHLSALADSIERKSLLQTLRGRVSGDNFAYYPITPKFDVTIVVDTLTGDADLYIAEDDRKPHYRDLSYNMSSATYGREIVVVEVGSLKTPIVIGVLGHVVYSETSYQLSVLAGLLTVDEVNEVLGSAENVVASSHGNEESTGSSSFVETLIVILKFIFEVLL